MAKQVHIRLDDTVYEALSEYTGEVRQTVQDCVFDAFMQFLNQQKQVIHEKSTFFMNFLPV